MLGGQVTLHDWKLLTFHIIYPGQKYGGLELKHKARMSLVHLF